MNGVDNANVNQGIEDARESLKWFGAMVGELFEGLRDFLVPLLPELPEWIWPLLILLLVVLVIALLAKVMGKAGRGLFKQTFKRFALGLPMDGRPRTDATMTGWATRKLSDFHDVEPSPWHNKPYLLRALIRWAVVVWFVLVCSGYIIGAMWLLAITVGLPVAWALIRWRQPLGRATKSSARWVSDHTPRVRVSLQPRTTPLALEAGPASTQNAEEPAEIVEAEVTDVAETASGGVVAVREMAPLRPSLRPAPRSPGALVKHIPAVKVSLVPARSSASNAVASAEGDEDSLDPGQIPLTAAEVAEAHQKEVDEQLAEDSARDMRGEILMPLWGGVRLALNLSRSQDPHKWITLPDSVDVDDAEVVIKLPLNWQGTAEERAKLDQAVKSRLPSAWDSFYRVSGAEGKHFVTYRKVPSPPQKVHVKDVWDLIEKADPTAPIIGIGPRGTPITANLVDDSPHIAISMGSGAGKSTLVRALLAQMLHHGATAHILDIKRSSHRWANGLPNVKIYRDVEAIHDALVDLGEEAERRHKAQDYEDVVFPRLIIVVEEMNMLADALEDYWEECKEANKQLPKEERETLPSKSPAFKGLAAISFGGRSVYANIIAIAQKLDARLFGSRAGGAARENFALRIMARFTHQAWKQLADIKPMAKLAKILGRVAVVVQGAWTEAQVVFWPDDLARHYATSGTVTPVSSGTVTAHVVREKQPPASDLSQGGLSQDQDGDTGQGEVEVVEGETPHRREKLDPAPWDIEPEEAEVVEDVAEIVEEPEEEERTLVTQTEAYKKLRITSVTPDNFRQIYRRERKKKIAPEPVQEEPRKLWDLDEVAVWWNDYESEKKLTSGKI